MDCAAVARGARRAVVHGARSVCWTCSMCTGARSGCQELMLVAFQRQMLQQLIQSHMASSMQQAAEAQSRGRGSLHAHRPSLHMHARTHAHTCADTPPVVEGSVRTAVTPSPWRSLRASSLHAKPPTHASAPRQCLGRSHHAGMGGGLEGASPNTEPKPELSHC